MSWHGGYVDGPLAVPIFNEAEEVVGYVEGYHLNVPETFMPPAAEAYRVTPTPATPFCSFMGAPTAFLKFADEAQARATLPAAWWLGA